MVQGVELAARHDELLVKTECVRQEFNHLRYACVAWTVQSFALGQLRQVKEANGFSA